MKKPSKKALINQEAIREYRRNNEQVVGIYDNFSEAPDDTTTDFRLTEGTFDSSLFFYPRMLLVVLHCCDDMGLSKKFTLQEYKRFNFIYRGKHTVSIKELRETWGFEYY